MKHSTHLHDDASPHAGHVHGAHAHATHPRADDLQVPESASPRTSVLGWPAWRRVLAVLPVLLLMWLAVWWASAEVAPW